MVSPSPDAGNMTGQGCHGGAACVAGSSCGLDCAGQAVDVSGLRGAGIICNCVSGSYSCRVVWEGTGTQLPAFCPMSPQGTSCANRCNICRINADASSACFCSADLTWVCS
jgi:hypothetical protein